MNEFNMLRKCRINPCLWPRIGLLNSCWDGSQATSWGTEDRHRLGLEKHVGRRDREGLGLGTD